MQESTIILVTKRVTGFLLFYILMLPAANAQSHPSTDDEFVGPFPSWANVITQFGASGNGTDDDTDELQAAFNSVGNSTSTASVVYLPAGTYRITRTLTMNGKMSVSIIGADPATTKIIWGGSSGDTMMQINGTAYSRFNRITWDGKGLAAIAIDQSWSGSGAYFDTGNEYADNVFMDTEFGIKGGALGHGFAETAIMRCRFIRNSKAGVSLENFNALDIWIWHSEFENCRVGVTNDLGAGNFKVYNSVFRNSTVADMLIGNNGEFSIRDNTSINSQNFLTATFKRYPYNITIQGNTIIDPVANPAIDIRNQGPVVLLDNIFRSRENATGPVISQFCDPSSDLVAMDNTFTVASPISTNARNIIYGTSIVSRSSLSNLAARSLPAAQPQMNRQVFEVPAGANAGVIQNLINQASALAGTRPIVHFPHGTYSISSTLNIPAGSDVQLVGDGDGDMNATWLHWAGTNAGPVIKINGPSKATLRDFSINSFNAANNIVATRIDQPGSRVFMHQLESHLNGTNLFVNGLDNGLTLAHNSRFSSASSKSINVVGGPLSSTGMRQTARTIIYAGLGWDNNLSNEVTSGGNLLVRDVWYESTKNRPYLNLFGYGAFTVDGSHVTSPRGTAIPQMNISDLNGKASFINTYIQDRIAVSGNGSQTKVMALGVVTGDASLPVSSTSPTYIENTTNPAGDVRSFNARSYNNPNLTNPRSGSYALDNLGQADSAFIANMMEPSRTVHAQVLTPLPDGVTDLRIYRVWTYKGLSGLELQGSNTVLPVRFFSFNTTCKSNRVTIQWTTGQELNAKRFDIEASENGSVWKTIGTVPASKSNQSEKEYKYSDYNSPSGFYRIVSYGIDNDKTIGPVLKIACEPNGKRMFVYPNPINDIATVSITSEQSANVNLLLYDYKGSVVQNISNKVVPGTNHLVLDMKSLAAGIYTLRAYYGQYFEVYRLIKK